MQTSITESLPREPNLNWHRVFLSLLSSVQFNSIAQSSLTLCDPMDCSTPGSSVHHHNSRSLPKLMSIESVMPSNHLILCCPLLLPPLIFLSIRVFSSESVLCIRWTKYWSFGFSISPSSEYSGLISFLCVCVCNKVLLKYKGARESF